MEEFEEGRSSQGLIDVVPLNITTSVHSNIPKAIMTMGVYGRLNMTWTYRVESDVSANSAMDQCGIFPVAFRSEVSDDNSFPSGEMVVSPTTTFSEALLSCSPPGVRFLHVDNETSDCECLTKEEAIGFVAFAVFTAAMIVLMTFPFLHYMKRYWLKVVPSPTGEAILTEIREKRKLHLYTLICL